MSKKEYKRLVDYIREVNVRNREHRAMQAYAFEDGSEKDEARTLKGHNKNNVNSFLNRVQMKRIWNTFCEDISKNKGVKEMTFEKEIVKGFLQALGWSRYDGNLEEQYGLYNRKWIPDFVFYLNNDKNAKEIILELKKPDHKQRKI